MYLSIFLGPFSRGPAEDVRLIDQCLEQAVEAAEAGFAMVTFGEQHFNNYEPYCNPLLMGARLSGQLKQAYFGTTVVPLPFHNPLRLAEDINVLDVLMRGRLVVGLSAGRADQSGFSPDFKNFGLEEADREAIFNDKLDLLLKIFAHRPGDPTLAFETPWDKGQLHGRMMPLSYRAPRPLLAMGSNRDAVIAEAGAWGWPVFLGGALLPEAARKFALHRAAMQAAGHSTEAVRAAQQKSLVLRHVIVGETEDEAWERAERLLGAGPFRSAPGPSLRELSQVDLTGQADVSTSPVNRSPGFAQAWVLAGSPESVVRQLKAYEAAGVNLLARFTVGPYNPEDVGRSFKLFVQAVAPQLNLRSFAPPAANEITPEHQSASGS